MEEPAMPLHGLAPDHLQRLARYNAHAHTDTINSAHLNQTLHIRTKHHGVNHEEVLLVSAILERSARNAGGGV
jgi:hypothetical protein